MLEILGKETLQILAEKQKIKEPGFLTLEHHNFGREVRNIIRQGGFHWGSISLDCNWENLVIDALTKFSEENG